MTTPSEEPGLFDLPLAAPAPPPESPDDPERGAAGGPVRRGGGRKRPAAAVALDSLPLFGDEESAPRRPATEPPAGERATRAKPRPVPTPAETREEPDGQEGAASLAARARATAGDLVVLGAVGALAAIGARTLGAPIGRAELAPLLLFLAAFSFLYSVISLAFWGQTPGMAWVGLVARTVAGEPLSFGQTALRWIGSWLTWATLGLAGLLALSGRSLADRLSGSATYALPEPVA